LLVVLLLSGAGLVSDHSLATTDVERDDDWKSVRRWRRTKRKRSETRKLKYFSKFIMPFGVG
jgi:hypothetical protein